MDSPSRDDVGMGEIISMLINCGKPTAWLLKREIPWCPCV
jgi:hypothetical protein